MTHQKSEPCPFEKDDNPIGMLASCCSHRGNMASLYLFALGVVALRLYADKTPREAVAFASDLRAAVEKIKEAMGEAAQRANVPIGELLASVPMHVPDVGWSFPAEQAFKAIEDIADWYEKTGVMGFGVHAWF